MRTNQPSKGTFVCFFSYPRFSSLLGRHIGYIPIFALERRAPTAARREGVAHGPNSLGAPELDPPMFLSSDIFAIVLPPALPVVYTLPFPLGLARQHEWQLLYHIGSWLARDRNPAVAFSIPGTGFITSTKVRIRREKEREGTGTKRLRDNEYYSCSCSF